MEVIKINSSPLDIPCFQDVGLQPILLSIILNSTALGRTWVADWDSYDKCDALVILGKECHLILAGCKGNGVCAWVGVYSQTETMNISSINGPTNIYIDLHYGHGSRDFCMAIGGSLRVISH